MPIRPDQLEASLGRGLQRAYLVAGEEPLLVNECLDAIRAAARGEGFADREVLDAGPGFDWKRLAEGAQGGSLFASRRLLELRIPGGKPGNEGSKAILERLENLEDDTLLLISAHGFESAQAKSKWARAVDSAGCFVMVYPVPPERLPEWVDRRMRARGLRPSRDAVRVLAERTEGNLLAADQEIEKLTLLVEDRDVDEAAVLQAVADSARFQAFGMLDAALEGDAARAVRSLRGLRGEGAELVAVMGAVVWQLHQLARIAAWARRDGFGAAFKRARVWPKKQAVLEKALRRHPPDSWSAFIDMASLIDRQVKGRAGGDGWDTAERLLLRLAGARVPDGPAAPA